jgi:hypothetical protein
MCGELRSDLFESLVELENSDSDFMLAMGTSLSGMNSDRIVSSPASRSSSHSTIIVSLQRTALDALASVRIFAKCDHFARLLAAELCIAVPPPGATVACLPQAVPHTCKCACLITVVLCCVLCVCVRESLCVYV